MNRPTTRKPWRPALPAQRTPLLASLLTLLLAWAPALAHADELADTPMGAGGGIYPVDLLWMVVASILVFFMQAGFTLVEAGFTRAKNTVNIVMKNLVDLSVGSIAFWLIGFGLMFGVSNGFFGTTGFALSGVPEQAHTYAFLLFQTVFCATAATIVSGAMAERTRFRAYLVYSALISAIIYPIFGSWAWGGLFAGGGWLEAPEGGVLARLGLPGFIDFAGSTVVHGVGGWAALAGAMVIGPRLGRFDAQGRAQPILGHNLALSAAGVFILWMGWFGFNAGSTTGVTGGAGDLHGGVGKALALIAVNTNLAACAAVVAAMATSWRMVGKPDVGISLNGALAGLVAITAPCASVTPASALAIGAVAGVLVVYSVRFFDSRRIDDPVGAISVHGVCGAWGTLAAAFFHVGGFSAAQLATQAIGVLAAFVWTFGMAYAMFRGIDAVLGLRVSPEDEEEGLDWVEHGAEAYPAEWGAEALDAAQPAGAPEAAGRASDVRQLA